MDWQYSDHSEDDAQNDAQPTNRKRSSRACDQCRKTKSKCERPTGNSSSCKGCVMAGTVCTFLGPSYKRGPPKGYIHAIEQRWHQVESLLGAIIQCPDPHVRNLVSALSQDELAREIIRRVDNGPYGPSGRCNQRDGATKEDFFASILRSNENGARDTARSRRQSRVSREIVSSSRDNGLSVLPTKEWQDNVSSLLASCSKDLSNDDVPSTRRRRLNVSDSHTYSSWDEMYTLEPASEPEEVQETLDAIGGLTLDENREVRFHGKSSGLHILSRATVRSDGHKAGVWRLPMAEVWPGIGCSEGPPEPEVHIPLPPPRVQDRLINLYFDYVHPMFPVLHKSRFMMQYNLRNRTIEPGTRHAADYSLETMRPDSFQDVTPLLLFSIFAITARFCEDECLPSQSSKMWETSANYSANARRILSKGYRQSKLSTVQSLLLMGYGEFGIGSMERAWLLIGMAMRMATDLGLHCDATAWKIDGHSLFTPAELQTRCQIWWACCIADRYSALYLGRPIVLKDGDFDLPLPEANMDEDQNPWPASCPSLDPSYPISPGCITSCWRAFASLCLIAGNIVMDIYPVRRVSLVSRKAKYSEAERKLDQWFIDLPDQLRYDITNKSVSILPPPPHILFLHIRYWAVVLLLNRAFIPISKRVFASRNSLELKAFDLAHGAATHVSSIVTVYRETFSLKRSSPFMTAAVLAAGIMHLLTLTLRPANIQASIGFQQCMTALEEIKLVWPSAARAWDLLKGVELKSEDVFTTPQPQYAERQKRPAEVAFGQEKGTEYLPREASTALKPPGLERENGELGTKTMAHMLGLNIPGIEAPASYYSGYEWWPRSYGGTPEESPSPHDGNPRGSSPRRTATVPPSLTNNEWTQVHNTYSYDFGNRFSLS